MRIVALDYGEKRVGVAAGDTAFRIAFPVGVLPLDLDVIVRCLLEQGAERVVVGMPYHLSGESGPRVALVESFIEELQARVAMEVDTLDERLTSREAERRLIESGSRHDKRKQIQDALAATLILETYLARLGGKE
jgi:putative Holliday junction resolvase